MKITKHFYLTICVGLALAATTISQAAPLIAGTSIGIDFGPTAPTNDFNDFISGPTVVAGSVIDTTGTVVNGVSMTVALNPAGGGQFSNSDPSVPSTYSVTAPAFYADSNTTDWIGTFSGPTAEITVTFTGLDDALTYDLNIYSGMNGTQDIIVDYTVGATTLTASADHGTSTFSPFVDFSGLSSTGGQLIITASPGTGSLSDLNTISALHITAVPEPSTGLLFGGAIAFALLVHKFPRKTRS